MGKIPVRVRSALQLSCFLTIAGAFSAVFSGWNFSSKAPLVASLFFGVLAAIEFGASKRKVPRPASLQGQRVAQVLKEAEASGFLLIETEGGIFHERTIEICGRNVAVRLPADSRVFEAILPFAKLLFDNPERVATAFDVFKKSAPTQVPAEELEELTLEAFEFFSLRHPGNAEVVFRPTSSQRFWVAIYSNGEFGNLSEET